MSLVVAIIVLSSVVSNAYSFRAFPKLSAVSTSKVSLLVASDVFEATPNKPGKEPEKVGWEKIQQAIEDAKKDPSKIKGPPIYTPGPYYFRFLAALAYAIPIADASDLGKYMFEAYPAILEIYNSVYGPLAGIYNGVPFLSFAVFFLMSYVCRAPTFPTEIRFHVSQAFMLSIIQFIPSFGFGLLEKAGVPGMAVPFNTGKTNNCYH